MQAPSGNGLAAKQRVTVEVVTEFLQEAQDVRDAVDRGQGEGMVLLVKVGCKGQTQRARVRHRQPIPHI